MTGNQTLLNKLRAAAAREYSSNEPVRRYYRDGFTDGWDAAHENFAKIATQPGVLSKERNTK